MKSNNIFFYNNILCYYLYMKFFGINVYIVIFFLIALSWLLWITNSKFVCDNSVCYVSNKNMFNIQVSSKTFKPEDIIGFNYIKSRGRVGEHNHIIIILKNSKTYKIPKDFGNDESKVKFFAESLQKELQNKPLNIYEEF